MSCNCKKRFVAEVKISYEGINRPEIFLKYECINSGKVFYYNKETLEQVDFGGRAGEELIKND